MRLDESELRFTLIYVTGDFWTKTGVDDPAVDRVFCYMHQLLDGGMCIE